MSKKNENDNKITLAIPTCNILGVNIAAINMEWLIDYIRNNLREISGKYICVANVHTTVMASEDKEYCKIQNNALLTIPDGAPLSSLGRRRGYTNMSRTTGPDFMDEIFKISVEKGYKHYFYGSTDETLDKLSIKLDEKYSGINIVGKYSPPYRTEVFLEDDVINMIDDSAPDFVWVGLGAPKQEKWMALYEGNINGLMVGVGAGFDYFADNIKRAPMWMQKSHLEWLYRLVQEPKRLFKRYLITNSKFICNAVIRGKK